MTTAVSKSRVPFAKWPQFEPDDVAVTEEILDSGRVNYWTGDHGRVFEAEFAAAMGVKHAVALANGTVALEAALEASGVSQGDEVILPPRTFVATGSVIVRAGAIPVFVDVERRSGNLNATLVEEAITPRTKAIIAVHLGGWPCEAATLRTLADKNHLVLIEDCAQAHGAALEAKMVGSFGHVAAWSFCQDKIMTTAGEGGMITTNDDELWSRIWSLKDHGKSFDAVYNRKHCPGFRWLHESFGNNWRLNEIQSAIGRNQLKRLQEWNALRTRNAEVLLECWNSLDGLRIERPRSHERHAYYKFYAYLRPEALRPETDRSQILDDINAAGVPCFTGSCSEIYLEMAFKNANLSPVDRLPMAKELGETSLMFLVHPTLSLESIEYTAEVVKDVISKATR